jgi:Homeodomain-like domain
VRTAQVKASGSMRALRQSKAEGTCWFWRDLVLGGPGSVSVSSVVGSVEGRQKCLAPGVCGWVCHLVVALRADLAGQPTYVGLAERDARIHELRAGGLTHRQIAAAVGCSRTTVARAIHGRLAAWGNVLRKTVVRAVPQVRQRQRPAGQGGCCAGVAAGPCGVGSRITLSNSADGHRRSACHHNG